MTERALLQQGLEHHHAGRLQEAADSYQEVLRSNAAQPDALYLLGVLAHQSGNQTAAIELMRLAIQVSGDQPRLHEILGLALMSLDRLDEAAPSLVRATEAASPEAFNNLGILRRKQGRIHEAIAAFERAIRGNPTFADALCNLGNAHYSKKQFEAATRYFGRAVAANPAHADAQAALGQALGALGRHAEAIPILTAAVELRPPEGMRSCAAIWRVLSKPSRNSPMPRRPIAQRSTSIPAATRRNTIWRMRCSSSAKPMRLSISFARLPLDRARSFRAP